MEIAYKKNDLAKWRKSAELTQEELARYVGVRRETISNLESGKYNPSLGMVLKICAVIGQYTTIKPWVEEIWEIEDALSDWDNC